MPEMVTDEPFVVAARGLTYDLSLQPFLSPGSQRHKPSPGIKANAGPLVVLDLVGESVRTIRAHATGKRPLPLTPAPTARLPLPHRPPMPTPRTITGKVPVPDVPLALLKDARHLKPRDPPPDPCSKPCTDTSRTGKGFIGKPLFPANADTSPHGPTGHRVGETLLAGWAHALHACRHVIRAPAPKAIPHYG